MKEKKDKSKFPLDKVKQIINRNISMWEPLNKDPKIAKEALEFEKDFWFGYAKFIWKRKQKKKK